MNALNNKQIKQLKGLAHNRKVVVSVGSKGLTESVLSELVSSIAHHELIKIKLPAAEKESRRQLLEQAAEHCGAQIVQMIGRVGVLYKAAEKPVISLVR